MSFTRSLEATASRAASIAWPVVRRVADLGKTRSIQPAWSHAALEKGKDQNRPELGWPRETEPENSRVLPSTFTATEKLVGSLSPWFE